MYTSFGDEKKSTKFTPNAALKLGKFLKHEIIVNKGNCNVNTL